MITYKEFRPTQFDSRGLGLSDQQDWLVAPVSRTRDSEALDRANFDATLKALGGESETVQVHRFGHWGPGWFEIIIINPSDTERVKTAEEIENALADYPVVNEELLSEYENADCETTWAECFNTRERIEYFRKHSWTSFEMNGESKFAVLRAAIKGSWYHAANLLHCPSDLLA